MSIAYMRTLAPSCRSQKSQSASPRRPRLFGAAAAAAAALYLTTVPLSARETVHEHTRVIDGDTIVINKERIRLKGIDAPELSQTCTKGTEVQMCGVQAKDAVVQWIRDADGDIECEGQGRDRYDRLLATCKIGGKDVGGRLVEEGFAVAYARYDRQYLPQQERAKRAGLYELFLSVHMVFS
ncbi:Succinoglycan biosynthesis protein ExoI [Gracilariopsis chorda]|uniref:Succinoglycan biosynthesis protein ExoI n=1 Tax=Gracilariopsis chorda TaxID=448386 RepID=A0A2V3J1X1_9FLOR|nr:Succinoglycan biosynthesis protein ExoI [Gracilariopsis chorda]|eukprot:PXF47400.1 Succinoglycan biosynthesis protein ExoI [Gracilariopsis chorda]